MHELQDDHYLRAVTELGDTRKIVASRDIYSQNGVKLVESGIHITSALYERLVKHKMLATLDTVLSIENMLDSKAILQDVLDLIQTNDKLKRMADTFGNDYNFYRRIILDIQLPAPLAFKLTVAREKYRRIYQRSLLLLIISIYLARCNKMDSQEVGWVATAALLQDLGMLHIDPRLLEPSHLMSIVEKRHLYTHPLTAYLLLCEFPELGSRIAEAVLEHHERMDGSGYPRGLHGNKISRYAQILAVAELAAKLFDSDHSRITWKHLDVILKLNSKRHGQGLIGHLDIFRDDFAAEQPSGSNDPERTVEQVRLIAKLFKDFSRHSCPNCSDKFTAFIQTRLAELRLELFDAGFDHSDPDGLIQRFHEDPECVPEYVPLLKEALWRFRSLVLEISRHWLKESEKYDHQSEKPEHAWLHEMNQLLIAV